MQKLITIVSFIVVNLVVMLLALYASSQVCLWVEDVCHIEGNWCVALMPLHGAITFSIVWFVIQGYKMDMVK